MAFFGSVLKPFEREKKSMKDACCGKIFSLPQRALRFLTLNAVENIGVHKAQYKSFELFFFIKAKNKIYCFLC